MNNVYFMYLVFVNMRLEEFECWGSGLDYVIFLTEELCLDYSLLRGGGNAKQLITQYVNDPC